MLIEKIFNTIYDTIKSDLESHDNSVIFKKS